MNFKKYARLLLLLITIIPFSAHADWDLTRIIEILSEINGIQLESIKKEGAESVNQLKALQNLLKGRHEYGFKDYVDTHSWGVGSDNWQDVLNAYQKGSGHVGEVSKKLEDEFPLEPDYKTLNPKSLKEKYNHLQAKTALASRAASQLSFDKVNAQLAYHHKTLQPKIDTTDDVKSAIDLQNRLLFENNLIQLEILRLSAISNQQQAIETQSNVNNSQINHFFNRKTP